MESLLAKLAVERGAITSLFLTFCEQEMCEANNNDVNRLVLQAAHQSPALCPRVAVNTAELSVPARFVANDRAGNSTENSETDEIAPLEAAAVTQEDSLLVDDTAGNSGIRAMPPLTPT